MYWDDYEPDYDSLDYHGEAGYHESLAEEGLQQCYSCNETYDYEAEECPKCARLDKIKEQIESGEIDASALCYACGETESTTSFMAQKLCWACYRSLAKGEVEYDRCSFADPGGNSALRVAGPGNPRVHPCPNCQEPNRLTPLDVSKGYQCDTCADQAERGY